MKNVLLIFVILVAGKSYSQQGTIIFNNTSEDGINSIGPYDSNKSLRLNGEKNIELIIDEQSKYTDASLNIFRDGPSNNPLFQVTRNGNIGIGAKGTSSYKLLVNGSTTKIGGNFPGTLLRIEATDESGAPARAVGIELHGYEGRGKGLYISDKNTSNKWFIGEGYNYSGIGIGYSDSTKTEYSENAKFFIKTNGNVGIGTTTPDMKLTVDGNIHAKEIKIDLNIPAPDYVFKEDYNLRSLEQVEEFIKENSHLPEIPSANEFEQNGVMQAEMDMNLLKKIEELTLYTIQQQKEIESLKKENRTLKSLSIRLTEIEKLLESKN